MKQKLYLVNYYSHLVGDSINKGIYLDENKAKKQYLKLVRENKNSILNKGINDDLNPKRYYKEALNSTQFQGDDNSVFTLCKIEIIETENIKKGDEIYIYNFCDEDITNSRNEGFFMTEKKQKEKLNDMLKCDEEYFEKCIIQDLEYTNPNYTEEEFEKIKQNKIKEANNTNCVYCYENEEFFCHKFKKVKVQ